MVLVAKAQQFQERLVREAQEAAEAREAAVCEARKAEELKLVAERNLEVSLKTGFELGAEVQALKEQLEALKVQSAAKEAEMKQQMEEQATAALLEKENSNKEMQQFLMRASTLYTRRLATRLREHSAETDWGFLGAIKFGQSVKDQWDLEHPAPPPAPQGELPYFDCFPELPSAELLLRLTQEFTSFDRINASPGGLDWQGTLTNFLPAYSRSSSSSSGPSPGSSSRPPDV